MSSERPVPGVLGRLREAVSTCSRRHQLRFWLIVDRLTRRRSVWVLEKLVQADPPAVVRQSEVCEEASPPALPPDHRQGG